MTAAEAEDADPVEIVIAETEQLNPLGRVRLLRELSVALAAVPVPEGAHKAFRMSNRMREASDPEADARRVQHALGDDLRLASSAVYLQKAARSLQSAETYEEAAAAAAPMGALADDLPLIAGKLLDVLHEESQAVTEQLDTWIDNLRRTLAQREAEREAFTRQSAKAIRVGEEIVRHATAAASATTEALRQVKKF